MPIRVAFVGRLPLRTPKRHHSARVALSHRHAETSLSFRRIADQSSFDDQVLVMLPRHHVAQYKTPKIAALLGTQSVDVRLGNNTLHVCFFLHADTAVTVRQVVLRRDAYQKTASPGLDGSHGFRDEWVWMGSMITEMSGFGWAPWLQRWVGLDGPHGYRDEWVWMSGFGWVPWLQR